MKHIAWLALLIVGFIVGISWKGIDSKLEDKDLASEENSAITSLNNSAEGFPDGLNTAELATIKLFERTAPSVCFITTSTVRRSYYSRNVREVPQGTGSGFVWDKKGHIVTNYHVIKGASKAQVTLADHTSWDATLVGVAPEKDLAILKIEAPIKDLYPIPVGQSDNLMVGQSVLAIGNPFGLDQTLTTGIVSALGREIQSADGSPIRGAIQTDAAINPGNSGGPLLNSSGKLIGVNTAIYSPSGASAGIGFSIPVDVVKWVVPELIKYGKIKRPTMGIEFARPLRNITGALVYDVIAGGPADKAGIQPTVVDRYGRVRLGDIIIGFDDEKINSTNDLTLALEKYKTGDEVKLMIIRDEAQLQVQLTLAENR